MKILFVTTTETVFALPDKTKDALEKEFDDELILETWKLPLKDIGSHERLLESVSQIDQLEITNIDWISPISPLGLFVRSENLLLLPEIVKRGYVAIKRNYAIKFKREYFQQIKDIAVWCKRNYDTRKKIILIFGDRVLWIKK